MNSETTMKVYGYLGKRETLVTIDERIVPGTLVFESVQPFPGYYHEFPHDTKPLYLYLVLREDYSLVEVERAKLNIAAKTGQSFEVAKGFIELHDLRYPVIRLRHISGYDLIQKVEEALAAEGIHLAKGRRKHSFDPWFIKLYKFFNLRKEEEGIYIDTSEDFHAYIEIPRYLSWNEFEEVTKQVKYNWELSQFDSAFCSIFINGELREFVRIYCKKITPNYLKQLRQLYLKKIK